MLTNNMALMLSAKTQKHTFIGTQKEKIKSIAARIRQLLIATQKSYIILVINGSRYITSVNFMYDCLDQMGPYMHYIIYFKIQTSIHTVLFLFFQKLYLERSDWIYKGIITRLFKHN